MCHYRHKIPHHQCQFTMVGESEKCVTKGTKNTSLPVLVTFPQNYHLVSLKKFFLCISIFFVLGEVDSRVATALSSEASGVSVGYPFVSSKLP